MRVQIQLLNHKLLLKSGERNSWVNILHLPLRMEKRKWMHRVFIKYWKGSSVQDTAGSTWAPCLIVMTSQLSSRHLRMPQNTKHVTVKHDLLTSAVLIERSIYWEAACLKTWISDGNLWGPQIAWERIKNIQLSNPRVLPWSFAGMQTLQSL